MEREAGISRSRTFAEIAPELENIPEQKLGAKNALYIYPWEKAGTLTEEAAEELKLCADTIVTGAQMDAHAGLPALGITDAGKVLFGRRNIHRYYFSREKQKRNTGIMQYS